MSLSELLPAALGGDGSALNTLYVAELQPGFFTSLLQVAAFATNPSNSDLRFAACVFLRRRLEYHWPSASAKSTGAVVTQAPPDVQRIPAEEERALLRTQLFTLLSEPEPLISIHSVECLVVCLCYDDAAYWSYGAETLQAVLSAHCVQALQSKQSSVLCINALRTLLYLMKSVARVDERYRRAQCTQAPHPHLSTLLQWSIRRVCTLLDMFAAPLADINANSLLDATKRDVSLSAASLTDGPVNEVLVVIECVSVLARLLKHCVFRVAHHESTNVSLLLEYSASLLRTFANFEALILRTVEQHQSNVPHHELTQVPSF